MWFIQLPAFVLPKFLSRLVLGRYLTLSWWPRASGALWTRTNTNSRAVSTRAMRLSPEPLAGCPVSFGIGSLFSRSLAKDVTRKHPPPPRALFSMRIEISDLQMFSNFIKISVPGVPVQFSVHFKCTKCWKKERREQDEPRLKCLFLKFEFWKLG